MFLDIDDVLVVGPDVTSSLVRNMLWAYAHGGHSRDWDEIVLARAREHIQALHEEFCPEYVITSSWVNDLSKDNISRAFELTGLDFVTNNLHVRWTTERSEGSYRLTEIDDWLETMRQDGDDVRSFVIIDDRRSGVSLEFSHLEERTVFCEQGKGFQNAELMQARAILVSQQ